MKVTMEGYGVFVFVVLCVVSSQGLTVPRWSHSAWLSDGAASPRLYWASQDSQLYLMIEANTIGSIRLEIDSIDGIVVWVDDVTGEPHIWVSHFSQTPKTSYRSLILPPTSAAQRAWVSDYQIETPQ